MNQAKLLTIECQRFVDDLLSYMTLEEKLGQLNLVHPAADPALEAAIAAGRVGGVSGGGEADRLQRLAVTRSRLGIPLLIAAPPAERLLSPWALAASWDEELACQLGSRSAALAARGDANTLSEPRIAVANDLSAARSTLATSQGHLGARMAIAFSAGAARNGENGGIVAMSSIEASDASAMRCGFDLTHGESVLAIDCPSFDRASALRAGFAGMLLGECRRLSAQLQEQFATTSARGLVEAAEKALACGSVSENEIDAAVRGVLAVKHALGLFRYAHQIPGRTNANDDELPYADLARRCMVLLRNESGLLPLSPVSDRVLVVGSGDGAAGACADALSRAAIGYSTAPGLALRRDGEPWSEPVAADHFALSLTRDAAQRADFVLVALDHRHFVDRGAGPWLQPGAAVLAMLQALSNVGSRLVAIIAVDDPVDLAEADQFFSAVLHCWGPRPGLGQALADILSGRASPQGRMPVTAGRFEFGQGLGYGESVFSSLALSVGSDHVSAAIRVRNSGSFPARETIQVYVRDVTGQLRLVDFANVTLAPGEDVPVRFELRLEALGEIGAGGRLELHPGPREILVGRNMSRLLGATIEISPALVRAIRRQDVRALHLAAG